MICLLLLGDLSGSIPALWLILAGAFACYGAAVLIVLRRGNVLHCSNLSLLLVLIFGLLFRATLLASPPSLSHDVYRYVWDGRVQGAGINPYAFAPSAPNVAKLRDASFALINHPDISTIYPPLSQLLFRVVCTIHPGPFGMKVAFLLCEAGIVAVLIAVLRRRGLDESRVLIYAWNPLAIVEIAGSGHMDPMGILLLLLAAHALSLGRRGTATATLAGAFLAKLLPALALPLLWRRLAAEPISLRPRLALIWFPIVVAGGLAPYAGAGWKMVAGLSTYLDKWRFNDAAFSVAYWLLRDPTLAVDDAALALLRQTSALLLAAVACWAGWRIADPFRALFLIFGAYLLLSPTLHPWYLLWILPFLALFPNPAWLLLSGLVFLAYEVLIGYGRNRVWVEQDWVKWAQFGPFFLTALATPVYRRWRPAAAGECME